MGLLGVKRGSYRRRDPRELFLKHVQIRGDGCRIWVGAMNECRKVAAPGSKKVYLYFRPVYYLEGEKMLAKRAAWILFKGLPVPKTSDIGLICGDPKCVFEGHLYDLSQSSDGRSNQRQAINVSGIDSGAREAA